MEGLHPSVLSLGDGDSYSPGQRAGDFFADDALF